MTTKRYRLVIPKRLDGNETAAGVYVDEQCAKDGLVRVGPLKFDHMPGLPFVAFDATSEGWKLWDIWSEGHNDMGHIGLAQKVNAEPIEAASFDAAVRKHVATLSTKPPYPGGTSDAGYYFRHDDGHWSQWACRLYPDEESARRFMG